MLVKAKWRGNVINGICILIVLVCSSWGFLVHRTTTQLAIYMLPKQLRSFYAEHSTQLNKLCTHPDERRNKDAGEAPKHFVDLEPYERIAKGPMPMLWQEAVEKYSADSLHKYGYVPYQVQTVTEQLTNAFKENNTTEIVRLSADLAHYIEDAHVPLHTTENYDGQLTNQVGLHALWESVVPELELNNYQLYQKHKATFIDNQAAAIWSAVNNANKLLPQMIQVEKDISAQFPDSLKYRTQVRKGKTYKYYTSKFAKVYGTALAPTINQQLLASSNLVADFWYTAWVNAGKPSLTIQNKRAIRQQLKAELKSYKRNTLIADTLLMARKNKTAGSED